MKKNPAKKRPDQAKENRRSARAVIGEPSRGRKRGPHADKRPALMVFADDELDLSDEDHDANDCRMFPGKDE